MTDKKEVAIAIKDIHKEFILPQSKNSTFKQTVVNIVKKNKKVVQKVLDGVSFDVNKGDFFGIVGRNGSGKSTLLKLIAGVYTPTLGSVDVNGELTPFIELGVGFNPELTGRDNVYLNGALLGFNRKKMDTMYDDIVEFAELGQFMDQKLKNYSSGMQVRLAFSIAIKAKNDILMFDEVLAVGDEAFQRKCIDVFEQYKANGQTVVLVTHAMDTVKKFCNRAALINDGKVIKIGNPKDVADEYSRLNQIVIDNFNDKKNENIQKNQDANQHIEVIMCKPKSEKPSNSFVVNEKVKISLSWIEKMPDEKMILDLYKNNGVHVSSFTCSTHGNNKVVRIGDKRKATMTADLNLSPGGYYFAATLVSRDFLQKLSTLNPTNEFSVLKDWAKADYVFNGLTGLSHEWVKE